MLVINQSREQFHVRTGDRIAQFILIKIATPKMIEVETLPETSRDERGFRSTGKAEISVNKLTAEQLQEVDVNPNLSREKNKAGRELLWEFRDLFVNDLKELGQTDLVEHEIRLKPDAKPYYCPGN